jgi:ectoine hydroxylase-related dioxygenase (phytanoyl-CoA dioxygenase family)
MDFTYLRPEQRKAIEEDGFLVVRNVLDSASIEKLIEAGDRRAGSFVVKPRILNCPEYNHLDLRPGVIDDPAFFHLVSNSSVVSLIVQLLGPNIHLHSVALIYKRPENPNAPVFRRGWHRDIRMAKDIGDQPLPRVGIKACYCLTNFYERDSGMTLFARRSHLSPEPLVVSKGRVDPSDFEVCDLMLNAGDVVLFENRVFHTAAPNRSNRMSRVVIYGYAYRWMKPEVYLEHPNGRLLERADPITRQLLGEYRDVDTRPWALERWAVRHGVKRDVPSWTVDS